MNIFKKAIATVTLCAMALSFSACRSTAETLLAKDSFKICCSFYPMYVMTMNIAGGIDGVEVVSMSDPNMGCIHDHVFSTEDLKKIEGADVFVENGLELEVFNDEILAAYPDVKIINASANVKDAYDDGDEVNGHVWTSIDDYELQITNVCIELQKADPAHAEQYKTNAAVYLEKIDALRSDNADVIASLNGVGALVLDETLPSFCIYTGMDFITVETDHENEALSAGDIADIISEMNEKGITLIFVGAGEDTAMADAIAAETGATVYTLNTCMTGNEEENAYIDQMNENFEVLSDIIG
ncbi:MAG: zinc ABC transporter substrate-binding protein [Clostridiales bacterium]|nr:zinc ABC transporter substrate-binding protein [Clostridiales bacterium]